MKSLNAGVHSSVCLIVATVMQTFRYKCFLYLISTLSVGGGLVGIMNMARIGWISAWGGRPSAISIAVIPKLHMSALVS